MATSQAQDLAAEINPLRDAGILQHTFTFLPGHWLFLGAVCSEWKAVYARMRGMRVPSSSLYSKGKLVTCGPETTCYSAAVASPATAGLASSSGLRIRGNRELKFIAGLHADMNTLTALRGLGMAPSSMLIMAVAQSGRLSVLQQLLSEQQCPQLPGLSQYAARSGSISMLNWLRTQSWCVFDYSTCAGAVFGRQLAALQHLRTEGCSWDEEQMHRVAASSGSIEIVEWLRQQGGIRFDAAAAMASAAGAGQTAMCEHLRSIGCDWNSKACSTAAVHGHLETLRWLREHGCPWDVSEWFIDIARYGRMKILDFIVEQGEVLDAELMTAALNCAGASGELQTAQWFRHHGAQWPAVLGAGGAERHCALHWGADAVAWARAEGCTSPTRSDIQVSLRDVSAPLQALVLVLCLLTNLWQDFLCSLCLQHQN
jgi:hypothetical protein